MNTVNFTFGLMITVVVLLIIAATTPYFLCGNIIVSCNNGAEVASKIFFLIGIICLAIVMILDIIAFVSTSYRSHRTLGLVRLILLGVGVVSLIICILIQTAISQNQWSYLFSVIAMTIGLQLLIMALMSSSCTMTTRSSTHVVVRETVVSH